MLNKIIQVTSHQLQQLVLSLLKRDRLTSEEERQGAQQIVVDSYEIPWLKGADHQKFSSEVAQRA